MERCFTITIDNKKFGPYLHEFRNNPEIVRIEHLKGISVEDTIYLESGWLPYGPEATIRAKRDKYTPLLDGIDFTPVKRQRF